MSERFYMLLATANRGKLYEIETILGDMPLVLKTGPDVGLDLQVEESGLTYAENARLKAQAYASVAGMLALGDDSGIEVDALGGAPGLYTARFAGPGASDADRYNLLLQKLAGVPPEKRTARFRCAVALATPEGEVSIAEGKCEGRIALRPAGTTGFGYDPVFYVDAYGCTMAELPYSVKNVISHRARALQAARPLILEALAGRRLADDR